MGIFSFLGPTKKVDVPPPGAGIGYGQFSTPRGKVPIVPAHYNGPDGWAPRIGIELPVIRNQDAILVHFDDEDPSEAKGDHAPTKFWASKNAWRISQFPLDKLGTTTSNNGTDSWSVDSRSSSQNRARDPKEIPVPPSRPTAYMSPSNMRMVSPMRSGRGDVPLNNGSHFSMANMRRTYPIRGMRPATTFRNTYRLEPPPRDAQNVDIPSAPVATVPGYTNISPNFTSAPKRGGTFRL